MSSLGTALAFLGVPALAAAQGAPLTLAQALEMAGRRNPAVLAARERAAAQDRRGDAVARSVWPRLSLSTSWSHSDAPSTVFAQKLNSGDFTQEDFAISRLNAPGALSHQTTVASLELPVDAFGRVRAQARGRVARALIAAAAIAAAGCGHEKAPVGVPLPARREKWRPQKRAGRAPDEVTVPAVVRARQRAVLSARLPASVLALPFREGDRVAAGAVLVRLDDAALRAAVSAAQASLTAAFRPMLLTAAAVVAGSFVILFDPIFQGSPSA